MYPVYSVTTCHGESATLHHVTRQDSASETDWETVATFREREHALFLVDLLTLEPTNGVA